MQQSDQDDRDRLIRLIEFELARANTEATRSGWTSWALFGALATVIWLTTNEAQIHGLIWRHLAVLFLAGSLAVDALLIFSLLLTPDSRKKTHGLRLLSADFALGYTRSFLASLLARNLCLSTLSIWLFSALPSWASYSIVAYELAVTLFFAIGLGVSFYQLPIILRQQTPGRIRLTSLIMMTLPIVGIIGICVTLLQGGLSPSVEDVRIAGLAWTASILSIALTRVQPKNGLTSSLLEIRRDLGLGRLDAPTAQRQVELAIHGLRVSDFFQEDMDAILSSFRAASAVLDQAAGETEPLICDLPADTEVTSTPHLRDRILAVMRSEDAVCVQCSDKVKMARAPLDRLTKRLTVLVWTAPETAAEIKSLLNDLDLAIREVEKRQAAHVNRYAELKKRFPCLMKDCG